MAIQLLNYKELTEENYEEIFRLAKYSWDKVSSIKADRSSVYSLIDKYRKTSIFICNSNKKIIGYGGCIIHPHIFNNNYLVMSIISIAVEKSKYKVFYTILREIEKLAKEYGCEEISFSTNDIFEIKEKNLVKHGYLYRGNSYIKEVTYGV